MRAKATLTTIVCAAFFSAMACEADTSSEIGTATMPLSSMHDDPPSITVASLSYTLNNEPCEPTQEICDGVDNDCDGEVDESFPGRGSAACTAMVDGVPTEGELNCVWEDAFDGRWVVGCTPYCRWREICGDYVDNDCDGEVNEGCEEEEWQHCNTVLDCDPLDLEQWPGTCWMVVCALNMCLPAPADYDGDSHAPITCKYNGIPGDDCDYLNGRVYPGAPERCDDRDNNCDGVVDEGCPEPEPEPEPGIEVCDGVDNDGDGEVDEESCEEGYECQILSDCDIPNWECWVWYECVEIEGDDGDDDDDDCSCDRHRHTNGKGHCHHGRGHGYGHDCD